jgi:hypothetical protein
MRPRVAGKEPPPWANATRNLGKRSNSPLKIMDVIAVVVSTGMPTSQGIQYLSMRSAPIMSQGMNEHRHIQLLARFEDLE